MVVLLRYSASGIHHEEFVVSEKEYSIGVVGRARAPHGGRRRSGGEYRYAASHITGKSKEHVLSVITAYSQTCDEGCKYYGPHVKEYVKIDYKKTESSWFT